jgi:C-terminal processing protease CtpA/Prc
MIKLGIHALLTIVLVAPALLAAEPPGPAPDFKEVFDLVRAHSKTLTEADLNRAAVQGFVSALGPKVSIVTNEAASTNSAENHLVSSALFDGGIGYVRFDRVREGLAQAIQEACKRLSASNQLKGIVLDVRFAGGVDYPAAVAVADLFLKKERPLLDCGKGMLQSTEKAEAISGPVAVLVNGRTVGAAEALAAVLREASVGLIFGNRTAGEAMIAEEYPLSGGERLRIATAPIRLGDGSSISTEGVAPDIAVEVSLQDERDYYADAFGAISKGNRPGVTSAAAATQANGTNRTRRIRFNEAELVRERRDGVYPTNDLASGRNADVDKPLVQDPVLARALDVLKGLAVVRASRS